MKKGRTLRKCYIFSRCTNSWSNLTLKCNANTFVKVDARVEGNCRRTISPICKGIVVQSFSCKKLNNQKHTANTVRNIRRTTFTVRRQLSFICVSTFTNVLALHFKVKFDQFFLQRVLQSRLTSNLQI